MAGPELKRSTNVYVSVFIQDAKFLDDNSGSHTLKDLKKRGFKFVGSTICYAYMQAAGMVNDHLVECFRYEELKQLY